MNRERLTQCLERFRLVHEEIALDERPGVIFRDYKSGGHEEYVREKITAMKHNIYLLKDLHWEISMILSGEDPAECLTGEDK